MLHITCSGTPYEIGSCHGKQAKQQVIGSIAFYEHMFSRTTGMQWNRIRILAADFAAVIKQQWPAYYEEMTGIADAATVDVLDIVALNVRTEINFGMFSDGCTALAWHTSTASYLAQNWDWKAAQKNNIVAITITQVDKPTIKMITEAGIIGKIGFNSAGVGVCLNAIRAKGVDMHKLPCHLGLRMVLESSTVLEVERVLKHYGIASSCHMLLADKDSSVGLEWSSLDVHKIQPNDARQIFHTNHYLVKHEGVVDTIWLEDSPARVKRVEDLASSLPVEPRLVELASLFEDEEGYPASICRSQTGNAGSETLFSIVMDLRRGYARVKIGRPTSPDETFEMVF